MSERLTELCTILIENAFGETAAHIFSTLATHGRLRLPHLQYYTQLPARRLRETLGVLIQHHVVLHFAATVEKEIQPICYQIDWDAAYCLVRTRKIVMLVAQREGEAAAKLVANVLQLGHASVEDLADEYDLTPASKRDSGIDTVEHHVTAEGMVNGIAKDSEHKHTSDAITTTSQFHSTLRMLLKKGYLAKVGGRSYIPPQDLEQCIRDTVTTEQFSDGKITGKKKGDDYADAVKTLKRKWEEEESYSSHQDVVSKGTIKHGKPTSSSSKRVKVNGNLTNGTHHSCEVKREDVEEWSPRLPNGIVVRVNVKKCIMILRSERLERMVDRFFGPVTAAIYGALLRLLEDSKKAKIRPERDKPKVNEDNSEDEEEENLPSATDMNVLDNLDPSIDVASAIKGAVPLHDKLANGVRGKPPKSKLLSTDADEAALGIKQEMHSDNEDASDDKDMKSMKERNKRLHLIATHLDILAEHPKRFCIRRPSTKETAINFSALTKLLMQSEIDAMIQSRFGVFASRMVRMLREKGKLDDKQISTMSSMRVKDVRAVLTTLQFSNIVDIQELPKDNSRQPSRTIYLYSFDDERVAGSYLQQTYEAMVRSLQRVQVERDGKFRAVIEKAERTDVKGREEAVLGVAEKEILKLWRDTEDRLLAQVARMDDVVALLRDFGGNDTSLMT